MQIHITKNGQSSGPYTLDEVNAYLASGHLTPGDMAWHEGAAGWMPLARVVGDQGPTSRPTPPPFETEQPQPSLPPPPRHVHTTPAAVRAPVPIGAQHPPSSIETPHAPTVLSAHIKSFVAGLRHDIASQTPQDLLRKYFWHIVGLAILLGVLVHFAYSIVGLLAVGTVVCLVVGLRKPETFGFLFGNRTSKATVGWTFGILALLLGMIGSSLEPRRRRPHLIPTPR